MRVIKRKETMATHLPGTAEGSTDVDTTRAGNQPIRRMIVPPIDQEMKPNRILNRKKSKIDDHQLGEIDVDLGRLLSLYDNKRIDA